MWAKYHINKGAAAMTIVYILVWGAYCCLLGAAGLNCCAPVTWGDGVRVVAGRGWGASLEPALEATWEFSNKMLL